MLLYVHDAEEAFGEFHRLLKKGGKLLLFDVDFDALSVAHIHETLTRRIVQFASGHFPQGRIGARLPRYFYEAGFTNIRRGPVTCAAPLEFTKRILEGILATGMEQGVFCEAEINKGWTHLEAEDGKGIFTATFVGYIVMGIK